MTIGACFRMAAISFCGLSSVMVSQAQSPASAPVAIVNGQAIYETDLTGAAEAQLRQLRAQEYEVKKGALETLINQRLFEAEANRRGIPVEKLLEQEVDAKIVDPSEAEIEAFYLGQKDRLGNRPLEEVKDQLRTALKQSKIQHARQNYVKALRDKAQVSVLLQAPKVEVRADAGRLRGAVNAKLTIIEFSDFQCPYCQAVQATLKDVLSKYDGRVNLGFRDFPLQQIHPQAQQAAEASRCAGEQGKFWEYHDLLFGNPGMLQQNGLIEQARKLQLDDKRFEACLTGGKFRNAVLSDQQDGMRAGVNGTPAFFVNGIPLSGNLPIHAFYKVIDEQLATINQK